MNIYLQCIIAGLAGLLFHIFCVKLPALKKRAKLANTNFKVVDYFIDDWLTICGSILTIGIVVFMLDEFAKIDARVMEYVKWFFLAVGYMGSSFLQSILSNTDNAINKVIDTKTDKADGKV